MTAGRSLRQIAIVLKKELKDSLRDRRALWSIVFSMTIGPVLIGFMMNRVAAREQPTPVPAAEPPTRPARIRR